MALPAPMPPTFADLGSPFPLFAAPVAQAAEYDGLGQCAFCQAVNEPCFRLGIGHDVVVACARCGAPNGLDADDAAAQPCARCEAPVPFPSEAAGGARVCYACLRAGRVAFSKDTVLGMVTWDPPPAGDPAEVAELTPADRAELLRTPGYVTWQGEQWQVCCRRPMIYVGTWGQREFEVHAPDGRGKRFFRRIIADADKDLWQHGQLAQSIGVYVFRCAVCGAYKGHWDMD